MIGMRRETSRRTHSRLALALAFVPLAACAAVVDEPAGAVPAVPLPWQESSPLARTFLQLPFEGPAVTPVGSLEAGVAVLYANSIFRDVNASYSIDLHVETAQATVMLRTGVVPGVEFQLAIPVVVTTGGFLDRPIEVVEGVFHGSNPLRAQVPRSRAHVRLESQAGAGPGASSGPTSLSFDGPAAGLGDVWTGFKFLVANQSGVLPAVAIRAVLKLPTGLIPYGSGEADLGTSVILGWNVPALGIWLELDAMQPTGRAVLADIRTRTYGAAQFGLTWQLSDVVALHGQASAHASPLTGTGLSALDDPTFYVIAGTTVNLSRSVSADLGLVENVFSPGRGADFTILLGAKARI